MTRLLQLTLALASAALLMVGCGDEGPPNPAPIDGAGGDTSSSSSFVPPAKRPLKRTVERRRVFGGPAGNLLVDGDFEFSITFEGFGSQTGWIHLPGYLRGETGGLCRTGLRCGVMRSGGALFGKGTAADGEQMIAGIWIKPPAGKSCQSVDVITLPCSFSGFQIDVAPVSDTPGSDGWCQYKERLAKSDTAICMYVQENDLDTFEPGTEALVDSATLLPADGTVPAKSFRPMSARRRARVQQVLDWERKNRWFGKMRQPKLPTR